MNFFDHSLLMHKFQLVIENFRLFFKIQIVTGCLKIFHHLSIEKIHEISGLGNGSLFTSCKFFNLFINQAASEI
ncbi:MAG: hypothetical protein R6U29_03920, partial [Desulfosudaceae bacterium]